MVVGTYNNYNNLYSKSQLMVNCNTHMIMCNRWLIHANDVSQIHVPPLNIPEDEQAALTVEA